MATLSMEEFQGLVQRLSSLERETGRLNAENDELMNKLRDAEKMLIPVPTHEGNLKLLQPVLEAIARGNKIMAIKMVREATGIGLKEAKNVVEGNPLNYTTPASY